MCVKVNDKPKQKPTDQRSVERLAPRRKFRLKELLVNCQRHQLHDETDWGRSVGRERLSEI